jgi:predicted GIY-YIG superfamily endonuclease
MNHRYKQMLAGMQAKEKRGPKRRSEKWFLYILQCSDRSLYTGIAKDLERRFKMHSEGKAARYTRTRRPLEMVYREACKTRTAALTREWAVKALPKAKKLALISTAHSRRHLLS